jgi:predicted small metal-binding protein
VSDEYRGLEAPGQDGSVEKLRGEKPSKEINMAKIVSCRDVGVDCDFVARGETEQDILQQCTEHARKDHGMTEIPAELADRVRGAIRDAA